MGVKGGRRIGAHTGEKSRCSLLMKMMNDRCGNCSEMRCIAALNTLLGPEAEVRQYHSSYETSHYDIRFVVVTLR